MIESARERVKEIDRKRERDVEESIFFHWVFFVAWIAGN